MSTTTGKKRYDVWLKVHGQRAVLCPEDVLIGSATSTEGPSDALDDVFPGLVVEIELVTSDGSEPVKFCGRLARAKS